ncbi:MAG: C1 family peptidase [Bacteroidales bacterium]
MKKTLLYALALGAALPVMAQEEKKEEQGFVFTTVKENPITPIKNQNRSGTCWSFSGLGFLESELIRMGKPETDLSEMFVVYHSYSDKADKYVRTQGTVNFAGGGSFHDVLYTLKHYGAVPEEVYTGLNYGESKHVHNEMDGLTKAYVDQVITTKGKLTPVWKKGFDGILNAYLGELPETFKVNGKEYTPQSYAQSLGLNADDYVSITSYTHHPFYTQFAIEIPDNWRWGTSYNVPLEEMSEIADNAINNGYTIAWGADVSEKGFNRNGTGVLIDTEGSELGGSDAARWLGLSQKEKDEEIRKMTESPCKEVTVTQESRQKGFDNYETTDDHGMVIYGIAKDQTGKKYYMIKNSWGETGKYKGLWYISEPFFQAKTMNFVVHKDALPKKIAKKLGIK